ncbi:MAG TPA: hypothetical protein VE710_14305 [Candidatus Bathyarchaeia archaeon]|nr:hypothetical protein [Candidatus Bathyarchaeia archaeon]
MATVEAHQEPATFVEQLLGKRVRYQKHKPGKNLLMERVPKGVFQIEKIHQFGDRIILNDGDIVMEIAPTVMERGGRMALLLPTGEELYFYTE